MSRKSRFLRLFFIVAIIAVSLVSWTSAQAGDPLSVPAGPSAAGARQVYAYYFGWHTGGSWGDGRLKDRPAHIYDSADGGAVGRHIDEARGAGIDAFIMSWYGPKGGNLTEVVFNILLQQASARGFHAAVSIDMGSGGFNANAGEVTESLNNVINGKAGHPGYLRYGGKPVIYFWAQDRLSAGEWANIRAAVDPGHKTIWVMEGTNTSLLGTFDGLYLFNIAWTRNFASTAGGWMSKTFGAGGKFFSATVMPGWDESAIAGRDNPTSPQARTNQFLAASFAGAASVGPNAILIVSWNEFLENSYIEPSVNFGTAALDTLRPMIRAWKDGRGVSAPGGTGNPAGGSTNSSGPVVRTRVNVKEWQGKSLTPAVANLRVRSGPGTNFKSLGMITKGQTFPIKDNKGLWFQIDFEGQVGWVYAYSCTYV